MQISYILLDSLHVTAEGEVSYTHRCKLPAGTGPRHLALTPDGQRIVVGGELGNTLSVLDIDREARALTLGAGCSLLPEGYEAPGTGTTVSHTDVSPSGKLVFVGNRVGVGIGGELPDDMVSGVGETGMEGAISVIRLGEGGDVELAAFEPTGGQVPREPRSLKPG